MKLKLLLFLTSCIALFKYKFGYSVRLKMSNSRSQRDRIEEKDFSTKNVVNTIYFGTSAAGLSSSTLRPKKFDLLLPMLSLRNLGTHLVGLLSSTFLPTGYPHTVPPDYLKFQTWYLLQDMCSYFRAIMSTKALLQGLGVGRAEMTAVQATLHWVMKDGASMIGGLLFTTFSSTNFGQNAKTWRLFADYIYNVGITLDLIAPMNQNLFLYFICLSSVCKSLCAIAAGATGSVISEHWGQWNGNVAEVNSKNKAQSMVVSLLCLLVSVPFTRFMDKQTAGFAWLVYSVLTAVHTVVSYLCVRSLQLRSINVSRGVLLVKHFIDAVAPSWSVSKEVKQFPQLVSPLSTAQMKSISETLDECKSLFSPSHIASIEPILLFPVLPKTKFRGKFGTQVSFNGGLVHLFASPSEVYEYLSMRRGGAAQALPVDVEALFGAMGGDEKYVIISDPREDDPKGRSVRSPREVFICFSESASNADQVRALFEACLVLHSPQTSGCSKEVTQQLYGMFQTQLAVGNWDLTRVLLRPRDARVYAGSSDAISNKDIATKKSD